MPLHGDQSPILMEIAKNAYGDALTETESRKHNYNCITALVFAHAALSAFVDAIPIRIRAKNNDPHPLRPDLRPLEAGLIKMENDRRSLDKKIERIPTWLGKKEFDRLNDDGFKRVIELIDVRNELLHMQTTDVLEPRKIVALEKRGLLKPVSPEDPHPLWLDRIGIDAAKWSINTCVGIVQKIEAMLGLADVFSQRLGSFNPVS